MNILQIVPRIPSPPSDGGAYYVYQTAKHLSKQGHSISMLGFISNIHKQDISDISRFVDLHAIEGNFRPYNLYAVLKSIFTVKPISIQHRMDIQKMSKLILETNVNPDIILLEGIHSAVFLPMLKKKFPGIRTVLRQSNVEHLLLRRNASITTNPLIKLFYYHQYHAMKKFEIHAMQCSDAVTAITSFDKKEYLKLLPQLTCFVNPVGVDIPKPLDIDREKFKILAISNWKWKPNLDGIKWFLELVWPNLKSAIPNVKLDLVGDGLSKYFKKKYAHKDINYLGYVEDLEPLRQSSTLFIAPLFSGSGMKVKIVEGLASGLPIVTTDYGAEGIEIKDNIHYLKANSPMEFSESVILLLQNEELRNSLSRQAKEIIGQKYDSYKVYINLARFLESI